MSGFFMGHGGFSWLVKRIYIPVCSNEHHSCVMVGMVVSEIRGISSLDNGPEFTPSPDGLEFTVTIQQGAINVSN